MSEAALNKDALEAARTAKANYYLNRATDGFVGEESVADRIFLAAYIAALTAAPQPDAGDEPVADDLVKRLRARNKPGTTVIPDALCGEAAATIERLSRELDVQQQLEAIARERFVAAESALGEARKVLEPFAAVADEFDEREDDDYEVWKDAGPEKLIRESFRLRLYRAARALIADDPTL